MVRSTGNNNNGDPSNNPIGGGGSKPKSGLGAFDSYLMEPTVDNGSTCTRDVFNGIKEVFDSINGHELFDYELVVNSRISTGDCIIIYTKAKANPVYVHPIIVPDHTAQNYTVQRSHGNIAKNYPATHTMMFDDDVFKDVVAASFNNPSINSNGVRIAGGAIIFDGDVDPMKVVSYAFLAIKHFISADFNKPLAGIKDLGEYSPELYGSLVPTDNAVDYLNNPVFSPVTLQLQARVEGYNDHNNRRTAPVGEVHGYMDYAVISTSDINRETARRRDLNNYNTGPIPIYSASYNITDIVRVSSDAPLTIENIMVLLGGITAVVENHSWLKPVLRCTNRGFNPLYDFSSVGYGDPNLKEPFDQCKSDRWTPHDQAAYMEAFFIKSVRIALDIPGSGSNRSIAKVLTNKTHLRSALNRIIQNTKSLGNMTVPDIDPVARNLGRIPLGTYMRDNRERDIRELMNYYSWSSYWKGDEVQMGVWDDLMVNCYADNEDDLFAKRVSLANEITNDDFILKDYAIRVEINPQLLAFLVKMFAAANIKVKNTSGKEGPTHRGLSGAFDSGFTTDDVNTNSSGVVGGNYGLGW
jgi:hypothetical protein